MRQPRRRAPWNITVDMSNRATGYLSNSLFYQNYHWDNIIQDKLLRLHASESFNFNSPVNTVSFNKSGNVILSGMGDRRLSLWNWETGNASIIGTNHDIGILDAKFMDSSDEVIISSEAGGKIRQTILHNGEAIQRNLLVETVGRVHSIAVTSPHLFYACDEWGPLYQFDMRTSEGRILLQCKTTTNPPVTLNLNSIVANPNNSSEIALAGSDNFVRLFDIRRLEFDQFGMYCKPLNHYCPPNLLGDNHSGISGIDFSKGGEILASYVNENIYLFRSEDGLGANFSRVQKAFCPSYAGHTNSSVVRGVSFFGTMDEGVAIGSDCSRMYFWNKETTHLCRVLDTHTTPVTSIVSHPDLERSIFASAGIDGIVSLWTPDAPLRAALPPAIEQRPFNSTPWMDSIPARQIKSLHLWKDLNDEDMQERAELLVYELVEADSYYF